MGFVMESTLSEMVFAVVLIFWAFYSFTTQKFNYWKEKGVPFIEPSFPFGSSKDMFLASKHLGEIYDNYCKELKNAPYFGVYEGRRPTFVIKDPDLVKRILTKDFQHFSDRFVIPLDLKNDYLSNHLFNLCGKEWKRMRLKLTPTFTSGKMKAMFLLMIKCKEQLKDHVERKIKINPVIDVKDVLARFTMDIIATCAFGLEINSLSEKDCEFYSIGIKIFKPLTVLSMIRRLFMITLPFLNKIIVPRFVPQDITEFLTNIVKDTVKYRKEYNVNRNDFLDLLIKISQNKSLTDEDGQTNEHSVTDPSKQQGETGLTLEEMAAQAFVFFAAGFETASSTMTFCLFELARNPEVQDKLYQEIKQVLSKHDGELTYQAVQDMTYMDQVVNETLRLYGSIPILHRTCNAPYQVPESDLVLEKGQRVIIPVYSLHHNPDYYPEPLNFDPERFAPDTVKERHPYVHLPFGEGPRMCIGMRFGLLQTKIGLIEMVSSFEFALSPETQVPVKIHKTSFVTMPEKPIKLCLIKREDGS